MLNKLSLLCRVDDVLTITTHCEQAPIGVVRIVLREDLRRAHVLHRKGTVRYDTVRYGMFSMYSMHRSYSVYSM